MLVLYRNQKSGISKLSTLNAIFQLQLGINIDESLPFVKEQLSLSKELDNEEGYYDAIQNYAAYYFNKGILDSANTYYLKSKEYWEKTKNLSKLILANNGFSKSQYGLGKNDYAIELINRSLKLTDSIDIDSVVVGDTYRIRGNIYQAMGNRALALEDFLKVEKFYSTNRNSIKYATALDDIGYLEMLMKNNSSALLYTEQAAEIYDFLDSKQLLGRAYETLGILSVELEKRDAARMYFEKHRNLAKKIGSVYMEAKAYSNLGGLLVEGKDFDEGIAFLKKSIDLFQKTGRTLHISHAIMNLGLAYHDKKDYEKAIICFNEAEVIAQEANLLPNLAKIFGYRSKSYEAQNKFKNALIDLRNFNVINDSLINLAKTEQIEEMRAIFDTERKEQQIAQQETEIALLEEQKKVSSLQKWLLGSGLGLSLLVFGFGFYGIRQKMKRNKVEREKVAAELAFKKKELTTQALHLAKKNETLENLKQKAKELKEKEASNNGYQQLITSINFDLQDDNNWENFARYFEEVHKDFNSKVTKKYPEVTSNELRLMALLKMNLSSKEIANILNISIPGIKKARQRLRKKMNLSTSDSLENAILSI
ncbi:tetratricopeptide repeat protein [Croceitalea dokdonensis]|uniref:tetratricopeptide repeat protein n=1 Tax=Croceitalea dokdonensis TaxID=346188 RepID=UPI00155DC2D9|nr:tetratricopeptide repeat protein [Croceitalea dokdonensis]